MATRSVKLVSTWAVAGAVLALAGFQAQFAIQVLRTDPVYFATQRQVVYWSDDRFRPGLEQVASAHDAMSAALDAWPENADYRALQARLDLWLALLSTDRSSANRYLQSAMENMEQSFHYRPANPYAWQQYAEYLAASRGRRADLEAAVAKVQALAPGDAGLQASALALLSR